VAVDYDPSEVKIENTNPIAASSRGQGAKAIACCADDYAEHPAIDEAIIQLLNSRRLSAVSALTESPAWPQQARPLKQAAADVADIGLHLNLTHRFAGSAMAEMTPRSLAATIARAYTDALDRGALRATIARQLDRFEDGFGAPPDYVDGHQHVHQLPVVRRLLLDELTRRYPRARLWLRITRPPPGEHALKARIVYLLGGAALVRAAKRADVGVNAAFAGVYAFDLDGQAWTQALRAWVAQLPNGGLVVCHPARALVPGDAIAAARLREFKALQSGALESALAAAGARLARISKIAL